MPFKYLLPTLRQVNLPKNTTDDSQEIDDGFGKMVKEKIGGIQSMWMQDMPLEALQKARPPPLFLVPC